MSPTDTLAPSQPAAPPDHLHLPDTDGSIVENFQEHPQANLLTECLQPRLRERYPDEQYCIGCDSGIYWRWTIPVLDGCKSPDWFLVPNVPPMLDGTFRRSYVLWREVVRPLIVVEFVSGDGRVERDTTPLKGKFWVYEQGICATYYAIYEVDKASVEVFRLNPRQYHPVPANAAGRFPIEPLGIELGIWEGKYRGLTLPWLRAWDAATGVLLPLSDERAEAAESILDDTRQLLNEEAERAEAERKRAVLAEERAETERKRAALAEERTGTAEKRASSAEERARKLAEKLRALGIEPEA